jgi:uncharacterized protein YegP (UPF0339 family)
MISGSCHANATVYLTGASSAFTQCTTSGEFTFSVNEVNDGSYEYGITQKGANTKYSTPKNVKWVRNSTLPPTPIITSPSLNHYSNTDSVTITGTCENGYTVEMDGDSSQNTTCASTSFSFTVNKSSDGSRNFYITQKNGNGPVSGAAYANWTRDTVAPSTPSITTPASNPYSSNTSNLSIIGTCETGATVSLTGDASNNMLCSQSQFSFLVNKSADGSFNFQISQTDLAGNTSGSVALTWNRNTASPPALVITNHVSPYISNESTLSLIGTCESNNSISVSGDATTNGVCSSGTFTINIPKSSDGNYSFQLKQTNSGNNSSPSISFNWKRDTIAPAAPQITNPASSSYTSSENSLIISGNCEAYATVQLSGDDTQSMTCSSGGAFDFTVNKNSDGTFNFNLNQTDAANNTSNTSTQQWTKSPSSLPAPVISSPNHSPHRHKASTLTIIGTCTNGYDVQLSGADTALTTCSNGAFSFNITKNTDGTFNFDVQHKSGSTLSPAVSMTWIRDNNSPSAPAIVSPAITPFYSNTNSILITGTCEAGATVDMNGDVSTASTICSGAGDFSFTAAKTNDGTYNIAITQTDLSSNTSGPASLSWIRDTVNPAQLTLLTPAENPLTSNDPSITISGNCEPYATVTMSGASTGSTTCSALGLFNFTSAKSTDGAYSYNLTQTDRASNASSALTFTWNKSSYIPTTPLIDPVITVPVSNPYYSNTATISITASCTTGLTPQEAVVNLSGDVTAAEVTSPAGNLSQPCTTSPVTFVVQKSTEQNFNFTITQTAPNNATTSGPGAIQWHRDTTAPSAPVITTPGSSPFTSSGNLAIIGNCEANATVSLSGDATASTTCSVSNSFSFSVNKSVDQTYNFSIQQTDLSGNTSGATSLQWVRFNGSVNPPTIDSPVASTIMNNSTSMIISGTCTNGMSVVMSGDVSASDITIPSNSLSQICTGGSYLFNISKSNDGTFTFNLKQSYSGSESSAVSRSWIKDSSPPTITVTSQPPTTNLSTSASFAFTSNDSNATYQCKLDSGTYSTCSSPVAFSPIANGNHSFSIKATDQFGNTSADTVVNWTQAAYNTLALYHLNTSTLLNDSSYYSNTLSLGNVSTAPAADTTGVNLSGVSQSRTFTTTSSFYQAANSASLNRPSTQMTVEARVKFTNQPYPSSTYVTLLSKTDGNTGWEIRARRRTSTSYFIDFLVCVNGTTLATASSTSVTTLPTGWSYLVVTFNSGVVKFYLGSSPTTAMGTATVTGGTSITSSSAPLRIGRGSVAWTSTSSTFSMDEIRISQTIRTPTATTTEFSPD